MASENLAGDIDQQRVTNRSKLFVLIPGIALSALLLNLLWEIVRNNVNENLSDNWPLRFSLLPLDTTATLAAAVGGLMLARAQFARVNRPTLGFILRGDRWPHDELHSSYWVLHIYNGGPGLAIVVSASYAATITEADRPVSTGWLTPPEMISFLTSHGHRGGDDFFVNWLGRGAPLPPVSEPTDGALLVRLKTEVLKSFIDFGFRVRVRDMVGDEHERAISCVYHLPTELKG